MHEGGEPESFTGLGTWQTYSLPEETEKERKFVYALYKSGVRYKGLHAGKNFFDNQKEFNHWQIRCKLKKANLFLRLEKALEFEAAKKKKKQKKKKNDDKVDELTKYAWDKDFSLSQLEPLRLAIRWLVRQFPLLVVDEA